MNKGIYGEPQPRTLIRDNSPGSRQWSGQPNSFNTQPYLAFVTGNDVFTTLTGGSGLWEDIGSATVEVVAPRTTLIVETILCGRYSTVNFQQRRLRVIYDDTDIYSNPAEVAISNLGANPPVNGGLLSWAIRNITILSNVPTGVRTVKMQSNDSVTGLDVVVESYQILVREA